MGRRVAARRMLTQQGSHLEVAPAVPHHSARIHAHELRALMQTDHLPFWTRGQLPTLLLLLWFLVARRCKASIGDLGPPFLHSTVAAGSVRSPTGDDCLGWQRGARSRHAASRMRGRGGGCLGGRQLPPQKPCRQPAVQCVAASPNACIWQPSPGARLPYRHALAWVLPL